MSTTHSSGRTWLPRAREESPRASFSRRLKRLGDPWTSLLKSSMRRLLLFRDLDGVGWYVSLFFLTLLARWTTRLTVCLAKSVTWKRDLAPTHAYSILLMLFFSEPTRATTRSSSVWRSPQLPIRILSRRPLAWSHCWALMSGSTLTTFSTRTFAPTTSRLFGRSSTGTPFLNASARTVKRPNERDVPSSQHFLCEPSPTPLRPCSHWTSMTLLVNLSSGATRPATIK